MESTLIPNIVIGGMLAFFYELYIPMLILMHRSPKRKCFWLASILIAVVAIPLYWLGEVKIGEINVSYLIVLAIMIAACAFIYKVKPIQLIFGGVASFTVQHIAWDSSFLIFYAIGEETVLGMPQDALLAIYFGTFAAVYLILFLVLHFANVDVEFDSRHPFSFITAVVILFAVWLLAQLYPLYDHNSLYYYIYADLLALAGLLIQIGYPHIIKVTEHNKHLENDKQTLEQLIDLQAKQQELSKETTDILNMKFHDLKNQLLVLGSTSGSQQKEALAEIGENLDIYSSFAKTGNDALDIIITQKGLLCVSKKIRLTYIIDGKSMSFMSDTDLSSLFGNILDNAVEALETEEEDFKIIKLYVSVINGFVSITEENYCHHDLTFADGKPVSTKDDPSYHGFGIRSIEYISGKYEGNVNISLEDDIFRISILIPISEEKKENDSEDLKLMLTDGI